MPLALTFLKMYVDISENISLLPYKVCPNFTIFYCIQYIGGSLQNMPVVCDKVYMQAAASGLLVHGYIALSGSKFLSSLLARCELIPGLAK